MSEIFDISPPIRPGMPVWPGDAEYSEEWTWEIGDGPVNVSSFTMSAHTGAHTDAPYHYANDGARMAGVSLAPYIGPCQVFDVQHAGPLIEPEDFENQAPATIERAIFRTAETAAIDNWDEGFKAFASRTIEFLAGRGCRLVGLDTPSLDPQDSKDLPSHMAVLAHDMRVLEGLVLDNIAAGHYELIALPLKFENLDASPVRAILRSIEV